MNKKLIIADTRSIGRLGNRMQQWIFANHLKTKIANSHVYACVVPEFGIFPELPDPHEVKDYVGKALTLRGWHDYNIEKIAYALNSHLYDAVIFRGCGMRIEYCQDMKYYRSLFKWRLYEENIGFDRKTLLIHIKLEDAMEDYTPLPISFYRKLCENTGLNPVFIGQFDSGEYCFALKKAFPSAKFIRNEDPVTDFDIIRHSKNIVLSTSSFCWLAAYFSDADVIHMPICGCYNPRRRPDINCIPIHDSRYRYYHLSINDWHATPEQITELISKEHPVHECNIDEIRNYYALADFG